MYILPEGTPQESEQATGREGKEMKKHLFHVLENGKGIRQEYNMIRTDSEMSAYLKAMIENYGYIPGLGGDKNYSIVAWYERG